ncbi:MAG: ATP-grasp domain-containing protein [Algoriphagus sp.]|uniref:ATP-grasp domain-containing protein n=1 Tax=Algoriphagus sp. TaxID=1872435 RepID=UPI0017B9C53E|nr:ATP-grasp domain-containing protein [Algoriphagus sp.]NVJ86745.1 ATP-grasp domain-containing protein [Algoriphagus sp.]
MDDKKIRVLVFPCGSEIGLEIFRSLKYSRHIDLVGASSVEDHGRFVFKNYFGHIPFIDDPNFESALVELVQNQKISAIYPTMDAVITKLNEISSRIGCKIIGSPEQTNQLALSKKKTYQFFRDKIRVPKLFYTLDEIETFPVFSKPDVGYGSRGTKILRSREEVELKWSKNPDLLVLEYLPGKEYTVDCFTDRHGNLLFSAPRKRGRIQKGISVNTTPAIEIDSEVRKIASIINDEVKLRGAWFFQVKKDENGELALLEIATRLGGSSALYRAKGINFALMSVFDAFNYPVSVLENNHLIELDRALDQRFKLDISYDVVYVDLDDCLVLNEYVNPSLIGFLFQSLNEDKKLVLLTKHEKNLTETLNRFRLSGIFDEYIHIKKGDSKADFIKEKKAIFIDDSFAERKNVAESLGIPVFAPDAVAALITE